MYDTSWVYQLHVVPSLWCHASVRPLLNLSLTPFPALSYHTQLMHTDLQVIVWEYSHDTEYKFLGEVSNRYIYSIANGAANLCVLPPVQPP